ncbi:MAG: right-handed parallel beta-helix repeat-containing protein [Eubacterium sp.]|nr:right-handed parallel beta-helix repeat-containing protein [Eubacterium sp.]
MRTVKKVYVLLAALVAMGAMPLTAATKAEAATVQSSTVIDVTDYGADGSDSSGDSEAIQDALDEAIGSSSVVTVKIPSGTYYIDKGLKLYSNTYLKLTSKTILYRTDSASGANILHCVDQNGERDIVGGYSQCHDVTIDGGIWNGGNVAKTKDNTDVVRIDHAKNVVIKNATFKNVYDCHLLELVAVKNGTVSNCSFSGFVYNVKHKNQVEYGREAVQIESAWTNNPKNLSDLDSAWASGSKIDGTSCKNIVVTGCTFKDYPICVGQHHTSTSSKYKNSKGITISNNTITAGSKYTYFKTAISCGGLDSVTISNNYVKGPYQYGTNIYEGKDISVKNNTFISNRRNSINVFDDAKITVISGNTIKSAGKHAISLTKCTVGTKKSAKKGILNNTIKNSKQNGICISKGVKVYFIKGNKISGCKAHGISNVGSATIGTKSVKKSGIQSNTIQSCKKNGISIAGASVSYIKSNKITSVKNNAISMTKGKIYQIIKNKIKKARIGIFVYSKSKVTKGVKKNSISKCTYPTVIR